MRLAIIAASLAIAPAAYAQNNVHNNQWNGAMISANSSIHGDFVANDTVVGTLAGGNSIGVTVNGNINFNNTQRFWGDAVATSHINVGTFGGDLAVSTRAFSNNAEVDAATACCINVNNFQAAQIDPTATAKVNFGNVAGDVGVNTTAVSNGLMVNGSGYANFNVNTTQMNAALTRANTSMSFGSVGGGLDVRTNAIGNNVMLSNVTR
jgi:hypothetical protein